MYKKNPNGTSSNRSGNFGVPQRLLAGKSERPRSLVLNSGGEQHRSVNFPPDFIDNDTTLSFKEKATSIDNIESGPKRIREIDSPTKSLQLEHSIDLELARRSSLCILALKTAASKATSTPFLKSGSQQSSLSSMISLPGVPPVQGVNEVSQVQLHREKSKKVPKINSRLQSEEDLILELQRKQEFKVMNQAKLKEESDILRNIRKREMIDKINKGTGVEKREKEEKKKITQQFGIAQGLLNTRNIFLAPIASIDESENDLLIPPPESDHPNQRRIVRRVVNCKLHLPPEMIVQAETRFSESPFVQECLEWHNYFRRKHLAPDLTLDAPLCATAQHWANLLAHKNEFYYQNPPDLGENLFAWCPPIAQSSVNLLVKKKKPDVSGEDAALYWYKSHANYDYEKEPGVLHAHAAPFSQMVWHNSTKFGCGKARSRSGKVIAVAYYEPKGNIPGIFHENVFPPAVESESEEEENDQISMSAGSGQKKSVFLRMISCQ